MNSSKQWAQEILTLANIKLNGPNPWDMHVHDERMFDRVFREGSLGLGEAYMDGWWDADALDEFIARVLSANVYEKLRGNWHLALHTIKLHLTNLQSAKRAYIVGKKHYDIGNDLYTRMLDETLTYSCGYWKDATSLADAQQKKLDLICRKIGLKRGQRILDIGCGWGGFAIHAAKNYGVEVLGVTISKEQKRIADERIKGLPIEIRLEDYRNLKEQFDHIVSIGMFEHVGPKNYRTYMETAAQCLKDDGLFLLHTIGNNQPTKGGDPWIDKYIFPNGVLPAATQITNAYEGLFVMEDWHNFGSYYDKTLMAWFQNFDTHWQELKEKYGERFYRMWKYYLLSCAGMFRARNAQLWQIVLSKNGVSGGYTSVR